MIFSTVIGVHIKNEDKQINYQKKVNIMNFKLSLSLSAQLLSHALLFATPWTVARQAPLSTGDSQSKNTGVGCYALLQGIFSTQGLNPGFLHCRQIFLSSEPPGKPKNTGVGSGSPACQAGPLPAELPGKLLSLFSLSKKP